MEKRSATSGASGRIALFDKGWEDPGCLEYEAWCQVRAHRIVPDGVTYFAVPWSRLIDQLHRHPSGTSALRKTFQDFISGLRPGERGVTVCRHPKALTYQPLFESCGIAELFWPHATVADLGLSRTGTVIIHPLPAVGAVSAADAKPPESDEFPLCIGSDQAALAWSAIARGATPVVMTGHWPQPGHRRMWAEASVVCRPGQDLGEPLRRRIEGLRADIGRMAKMRHAQEQLRLEHGAPSLVGTLHSRFLDLAADHQRTNMPLPSGTPLAELDRRFGALSEDGKPLPPTAARMIVASCKSAVLMADPEVMARLTSPSRLARLLEAAQKALPDPKAEEQEFKEVLRHVRSRAVSTSPERSQLPRRRSMRVFLAGIRGIRTPISYPPLQAFARHRVDYVSSPDAADIVLTGFNLDFTENPEWTVALAKKHPHLKFAVLSEEPLWDTTWSDGFADRERTFRHDGVDVPYTMLNHTNSRIFEFNRVPYFLLTTNDYAVRFRALLAKFARLTPDALLKRWRSAPVDAAFVAEHRQDDIFRGDFPEHKIERLSAYRTDVARLYSAKKNVLRLGKGWSDQPPRQELVDWHLDKLATLNGRVRLLSAIENTHQPSYITEKIFDAFAVGAIPIYHASPDHRIFDLVPAAAMINTWGDSAESAATRISRFEPTRGMAIAWLRTCGRLADLFGDTGAITAERHRVVDESLRELATLFDTE